MDIGKFTYILTIERLVECFDPPTLLDGKFFSNLQAKKKESYSKLLKYKVVFFIGFFLFFVCFLLSISMS